MKFGVAVLFFFNFLAFWDAQENAATKQSASPSIGLQVGQNVPAFASRDQFGRDQSDKTLRGPNGTILLFFRSADW